jgi:hypothetical protein
MKPITVKDFPVLDLGDKRRDERFVKILSDVTSQPGSSIPKRSDSWYDTKATYEFFKNEDISIEKIQDVLSAYGVSQVGSTEKLLIIHDMSDISYGDLEAEGLGYLDNKEGRGILCYSSMAVSTDGLPLALMYQNTWTRPLEELGKAKLRKKRDFEEKETYNWYLGMTEVNKSLGAQIQKVHIADRGADIYELFFSAYEKQTDLLVRAHYKRKLKGGSSLWNHICGLESKHTLSIEIPDHRNKLKKKFEAEVRYDEVEILRPSTSKNQYESVVLTAIEVKEIGAVKDEEERICWKLLTTLEVNAASDVLTYIRWYTYRWLIERFHFTLKSGTKIEALQFKQAVSLQKAIPIYSMAAFRVMQLVYESRNKPDVSCEVILTREQWIILYLMVKKGKVLPEKPPTLCEAVRWIGRLGGHLGRTSDGPPGLKTVWLGYQRVCDAANIYDRLMQINLGKG